jgi:hypothetical protein
MAARTQHATHSEVMPHHISPPETSPESTNSEMSHSETVFVRQRPNSNSFGIRWYPPIAEEPFCGHSVLGATHALHAARLGTNFDFTTFTEIKASATIFLSTTSNPTDRQHVTISISFPSSPVLPSLLSRGRQNGVCNSTGY